MMFIITLIILTGTGLFLAVLLYRFTRVKIIQRRLTIMMREVGALRGLTISDYQLLGDQVVAIDRQQGVLIFLNYSHRVSSRIVDLKEISDCRIILRQLVVQLELTYHTPSRGPLSISFFRKYSDPSYKRNSRTNLAIYWKGLITSSPKFVADRHLAEA